MKTRLTLVVFLCVLCVSCHKQYTSDYLLTLTNDSDRIITCGIQYGIYSGIDLMKVVNPSESEWLRWGGEKTESWRHPFSEYDTLSFYIFKGGFKSLPIIYDLNKGRFTYIVLARYDFSLQDMERLDWKFSYPPNEAMKDIKMDPPFSILHNNQ